MNLAKGLELLEGLDFEKLPTDILSFNDANFRVWLERNLASASAADVDRLALLPIQGMPQIPLYFFAPVVVVELKKMTVNKADLLLWALDQFELGELKEFLKVLEGFPSEAWRPIIAGRAMVLAKMYSTSLPACLDCPALAEFLEALVQGGAAVANPLVAAALADKLDVMAPRLRLACITFILPAQPRVEKTLKALHGLHEDSVWAREAALVAVAAVTCQWRVESESDQKQRGFMVLNTSGGGELRPYFEIVKSTANSFNLPQAQIIVMRLPPNITLSPGGNTDLWQAIHAKRLELYRLEKDATWRPKLLAGATPTMERVELETGIRKLVGPGPLQNWPAATVPLLDLARRYRSDPELGNETLVRFLRAVAILPENGTVIFEQETPTSRF